MELCDDGHDQVCYEDRECPACAMKSVGDEVIQAVEDLDANDLDAVVDGLGTLVDTVKELVPLMGSLDELLLTLNTSVKQLAAPWHDRESYQTFCDQVKQLDTLIMHVNALVNDKEDLRLWRDSVIAAVDQIGTVKNACP